MKFGVVVFPGSNCDRDMQEALTHDLYQEVIMLWHKDKDLSMFSIEDCIVLPGGFSYGDYLRCGAIARFSPMMQTVIEFANAGGKVLGICNGFQILCESHLLPGVLLRNANQQFIGKNIFIKNDNDRIYKLPIAHGEGRYYASEKMLDELESNGQVIFRYCDEDGGITRESNPNGALRNIAGICNANRNVFAMMPHPERACSPALPNPRMTLVSKKIRGGRVSSYRIWTIPSGSVGFTSTRTEGGEEEAGWLSEMGGSPRVTFGVTFYVLGINKMLKLWSWREELNLQPAVYKTAALPLSYASLRGISPTYVRDVNRRGGDSAQIVPEESARGVLNVGLAHDRIASIDGFGLVSADLHRHGSRHAGSFHIADRRAPEVLPQHADQSYPLTGL